MSTEKPLAGSVLSDANTSGPYGGAAKKVERRPAHDRKLQRKIIASKAALLFEAAAPRLWLLLAVIGLFIVASMAGLWSQLGPLTHKIVLGLFGLGLARWHC